MLFLPVLVIVYFQTQKALQQYHPEGFKQSSKGMKQFFIFEVIIQSIILITGIVDIILRKSLKYGYTKSMYSLIMDNLFPNEDMDDFKHFERIVFIIYIAVVPCLQAYGLVNVKKSLDPLSRISRLDYLKMVSINQRPTSSFEDNRIRSPESKHLEVVYEFVKTQSSTSMANTDSVALTEGQFLEKWNQQQLEVISRGSKASINSNDSEYMT